MHDDEPAQRDWRAAGERIDALLDASSAGGAVARERAEELVRLVADLYGAGLQRILELLYDRGRLDEQVLNDLADDDLVASLLLVHGLHPYDVATRVERALESVRPYLGSHGGDVELLEVNPEGVVRLQLLGSCNGCASSSVTLKLAVESAIEAAAPEVTAIDVAEPATRPAVIPTSSLLARVNSPEAPAGGTWADVPGLEELESGGVNRVTVNGTPVLVCRAGADLFAFADDCPRCAAPLAGATLARRLGGDADAALLTCGGCRAHYDVRRAGLCLDDEALHLGPLPLLHRGGVVSIAVAVAVPA